ncbi:MAG: GNAT family N-acetyltransferase [Pontiellaceae bacterium]|nr:GNAT family N-acetyltransferase [Pontiellaceae bacterium]
MEIRAATQHDIPAMAELLHQLFAIEIDFVPDYAKQTRGLQLLLKQPSAKLFVADLDGEVVGMCTIQIIISTAMGKEVGAMEDVVVHVGHRGKGIGSALMYAAQQWAHMEGLARLQLRADKDNAPALCFYRLQGWKKTNLIEWIKPL